MSRALTPDTALPAPADKSRAVEDMFDRIAPRYDTLNRVLTFRMDVRWRKLAVGSLAVPAAARVLDVACGTGDLCRALDDAGYEPVGVDFSAGMLGVRHTRAAVVRADARQLPFPDASFRAITCGFALRNFVALPPVFAECARVLESGGRIALLEVAEPTSRPARAVHGAWFRHVVPFVGGLFSDRAAYRYLPASTAYLPPRADLLALIAGAGFADVRHRLLGAGAAQLITATRT